jgi:hypothetical protein
MIIVVHMQDEYVIKDAIEPSLQCSTLSKK